ncbi:MAG: hypothetical protein J0M29_01935 [Chitinophagales bacterium]|nr:hypothetical protein [Chitinophagales bacterium]
MSDTSRHIPADHSLSEDEVKRRFVPFLRDFYKNRYEPMSNTVTVELDNVSKEGWVADGKITFRKSDGSPFVCTYEATSRDKADEVKFRLNSHYFLWDCAAFALVCAALAYAWLYETDLLWLVELKAVGNVGLLTGVALIGFFCWYFTMRSWRKYRYIYAIQQFRQYFADEQWVAIAADVFPAPSDPYLLELRNQCVYNGIGLAIVPLEGPVRKVIDPSRLGIFGKDRKMTQWITRADWYQSFSQNVGTMVSHRPKTPDAVTAYLNKAYRSFHYLALDPLKKGLRKALPDIHPPKDGSYARFMTGQSVQKWIASLAILLIAPLFYKVMTFSEDKVVDLKELQLRTKNGKNPEDLYGPQIDGEIIPSDGIPTGVPKQFPVGKNQSFEDEENTVFLSGDDTEEEPAPPPKPKVKATKPASKSVAQADPCTMLKKNSGWVVFDNTYTTREAAQARVKDIQNRSGISCFSASESCAFAGKKNWMVWIGPFYANASAADRAADNYARQFQRYGLKAGQFQPVKIK